MLRRCCRHYIGSAVAPVSYSVPNWSQTQMALAAGLDPQNVGVEMENDHQIVFLQYMPRKRILVSKADGSITAQQDKYADCRKDGGQTGRCGNQLEQMKIPQ